MSWGKAGNSDIDAYQTLTTLGMDKIPYTTVRHQEILVQGQVPANLGNQDLTWETTTTYDAGIDITSIT